MVDIDLLIIVRMLIRENYERAFNMDYCVDNMKGIAENRVKNLLRINNILLFGKECNI